MLNKIYNEDCLETLKRIPDNTIDLIFTSPPYAERRKSSYGGISEDKYIEWFLPRATEIKRVMKDTGSFFLNIKTHTDKGERSLYVMELVIALKKEIGFMFIDEYAWTKQAFPGNGKGRFKNGWEPVYHFTKITPEKIKFNPLACGTPMKEVSIARAKRKQCGDPENGSKMGHPKGENLLKLDLARPSNVIHVLNMSNQHHDKVKHPGTFPEGLVEFFIKSFSDENDTVYDSFAGSGTVGAVCKKLKRNYILSEIMPEYCGLIESRVQKIIE